MSRKPCPTLPAELWGRICNYTDDLTLWMVYRYVCQALRSEAEREFAHTRLHQLDLTWTCVGVVTNKHNQYSFISETNSRSEPSRLVRLVDTRAHFSINSIHVIKATFGDQPLQDKELEKLVTQRAEHALRNIDTNFRDCEGIRKPTYATAILGDFVNNNSITGFEMDNASQEFSFEWKPFLTTFFTDYLQVAKMKTPLHPYAAVLKRADVAEQDFKSTSMYRRRMWVAEYGSLEDRLFEAAYLKRSRRAHERMGVRFVMAWKEMEELRSGVKRVREVRNRVLWERLN